MEDNGNKRYGNRSKQRRRPPQAPYTPPYAEEILAKPLTDIGLSETTLAVLAAGKMATVGDVVRRRKQEMYRVQNFGKKHLAELCKALAAIPADFRPDENAEGREEAPKQAQGDKQNARRQAYVPPYDEAVLSKALTDIGLSEQTVSLLAAGKMTTVGDLVRRRKQELYRVRNFGKKHFADVANALSNLGVALRVDEPQAEEGRREKAKQVQNEKRGGQNAAAPREERGNKQGNRPQTNAAAQQQQAQREDRGRGKGKNKGKPADDGLTLDKLYPRPAVVRLPRIEQPTDEYVKFQRGGKWGFKDKSGHEVIPPIYDEVFNFKEDFACVERKQLFGYINRQNELVIPYKYACASSFSEGYACVSDESLCGYINKEGEVVVPFKYDAGTAVTNGLAHVKLNGKWGTLNVLTGELSWA